MKVLADSLNSMGGAPVELYQEFMEDITAEIDRETTTITGVKFWNDANDRDGIRPDHITVYLNVMGQAVDSQEVSADENGRWIYSFPDMNEYYPSGKKIEYTVSEEAVPGYTSTVDGYNITNTHIPGSNNGKICVAGSKTWDDWNDQDHLRPESIHITLLQDGLVKATKDVTAEDGWSWMFEDLDEYTPNNKKITYELREDEVEGYVTDYVGYDIINNHVPEKLEPEIATVSYTVNKIWNDGDDKDGLRPDRITVLLIGDEQVKQAQDIWADENGNWTYTFENLQKYNAKGQKIHYRIEEKKVEGYEARIEGFTIINTHTPASEPGMRPIAGTVLWRDHDDDDKLRPRSVRVSLLANGQEVDEEEVTEEEDWIFTFGERPITGADGKKIVYAVREDEVPAYETTYEGFTIINSHDSESAMQ